MKKITVLHDFDGTLVDSKPDISSALHKTFELLKLPTEKLSQVQIGPPLLEMLTNHFPEFSKVTNAEVMAHFRRIYDGSGFPHTFANEGVVLFLEESQRRGIVNFIATNKPLLATERILEKLNLAHHFKAVFSLGEIRKQFPEATKNETVSLLLQQYPSEKNETYLVGDSIIDIQAAKHNSIHSVAFLGGYSSKEVLLEQSPDYVIKSYLELPKIF